MIGCRFFSGRCIECLGTLITDSRFLNDHSFMMRVAQDEH